MTIESRVNIIQQENIQLGLSSNIDGYYYFDNGQSYKPGFRYNSTTAKIQYSNDGYLWADFMIHTVGGDLYGSLYDAYVVGFNGNSISLLTPTDGQVIYYNNGFYFSQISGDISGNLTDAYVVGLNGISLNSTTTPLNNYGYVYNASQNKWILQEIAVTVTPPPTPSTGGDCSGLVTNIVVEGINNIPLETTQVPSDGQVLFYDSIQSKWWCTQINGDVSGPFDDVTVDRINGIDISTDVPDNGSAYIYDLAANQWIPEVISFSSQYALDLFNVGGRLSLESGAAYMTDPAGYVDKTTLYWVPTKGGNIALFDGSIWDVYTPGELSITTSGLAAGKIYDVFMYVNTGIAYLTFGSAWTDDFTRSQELTTLNNVLVQPSTNYRYLGSIRTFGTSPVYFQYDSSNISLWNYYNRAKIPAKSLVDISVDTWSLPYTGNFRVFNSDSSINIAALIGVKEDYIKITAMGISMYSTETPYSTVEIGIGINSTTTNSCEFEAEEVVELEMRKQVIANYEDYIDVGYNVFYPLEKRTSNSIDTLNMTGVKYSYGYRSGIIANIFG